MDASVSSIDSNAITDNYLNTEIYFKLLTLEKKMRKNKNNIKLLEQAAFIYVNCIEQYDRLHDPIKFYFLEKLQVIIAKKKAYYLLGFAKSLTRKRQSQSINNNNNSNTNSRNSIALKLNLMNLINVANSSNSSIANSQIDKEEQLQQQSQQINDQNSFSSSLSNDNDLNSKSPIYSDDDNIKQLKIARSNSRKTSKLLKKVKIRKQQKEQAAYIINPQQQIRERVGKLNLLNQAKKQYYNEKEFYQSERVIQNEFQKIDYQQQLYKQQVENQTQNIYDRIKNKKLKQIQMKSAALLKLDEDTQNRENCEEDEDPQKSEGKVVASQNINSNNKIISKITSIFIQELDEEQ